MIKLKKLIGESRISQDSLDGLDNLDKNNLHKAYYGVGDYVDVLETQLRIAAKKNPDWKADYKIARKIQELYNQLEVGIAL